MDPNDSVIKRLWCTSVRLIKQSLEIYAVFVPLSLIVCPLRSLATHLHLPTFSLFSQCHLMVSVLLKLCSYLLVTQVMTVGAVKKKDKRIADTA